MIGARFISSFITMARKHITGHEATPAVAATPTRMPASATAADDGCLLPPAHFDFSCHFHQFLTSPWATRRAR